MDEMLRAAKAVRSRAHVPYSGFRVGAVLRGAGGALYAGCNVENAAYPQSQCAEATAIGVMVAAGETRISEILVLGGGPEIISPCGGCRQRLAEFSEATTPVHLCGPDGVVETTTLGELLPRAFNRRSLEA